MSASENDPETGLPPSWAWTTLAQVAAWGSGGTPKATEPSYYGGSIPWAVTGDLTDGFVYETASSLTEAGLWASSAKIVEPGVVLVAMYGASIGRLGIVGRAMATNQAIACARPEELIDRKYLFWYLRRERDALRSAGKGAAQPNISQTVLKPWPIPLAPRCEQERIVAVVEKHFSHLDAAVESLERARRNLLRMRAALLRAATEGQLVEQDVSEVSAQDFLAKLAAGISAHPRRTGKRAQLPQLVTTLASPNRTLPPGWALSQAW